MIKIPPKKAALLMLVGVFLILIEPERTSAQIQMKPFGIHAELPMVLATSQGISLEEQVAIIGATGTGWVRHRLRWDKIEPEKGLYDWTETDKVLSLLKQEGLEPLIVIRDTPVWARQSRFCLKANICPPEINSWRNFVVQAVARYGYQVGGKKLVRYWEVWNEPNNLVMFTGNVGHYFDLLKSASDIIRQIDTSAKVLMGGVTHRAILNSGNLSNPNWLDELFAKEGIGKTFDIFNFHLYGVVATPEETFVKVREFMTAHGLQDKPIWVTETNPSEFSRELLAQNIASWHSRIFVQGVERIFYFTLPNWCQEQTSDPVWCDESVYTTERRIGGLVKASDFRSQTLAYTAYQNMAAEQLTPTPTPAPTNTPSPAMPGDIDGDGDVDIFDYNLMIENFGSTNCGNIADLDGDCDVDIFDYNIVIENFGSGR